MQQKIRSVNLVIDCKAIEHYLCKLKIKTNASHMATMKWVKQTIYGLMLHRGAINEWIGYLWVG